MRRSTVVLYSLMFIGTLLFLYLGYEDGALPYDDVYSMNMLNHSYFDIARITSKDVHPPLYYWGVKTFSLLFGQSLFALRTFTVLGVFATMLLAAFPIRRNFGIRTSLFFVLLLIIFPVTQYIATEIRMYSWSAFFVLACALFAYDVYQKGRIVDWLKFLITGICAAYLHNYALIGVFWIYVVLLIALVVNHKKWLHLILCGVLFSLIYLPWLMQLIWQAQDVAQGYWIKPLTIKDMVLFIYYMYSPKEVWRPFVHYSKWQVMIAIIILMTIQLYVTVSVLIKTYKQKEPAFSHIILCFLLFLLPVFTGITYSYAVSPVFSARYMTCAFGLFVLGLALTLSKAYESKKLRITSYIFLFLLLIDAIIRFFSGLEYFDERKRYYEEYRQFINGKTNQPQRVVSNYYTYHILAALQQIAPGNTYHYIIPTNAKAELGPFFFEEIRYGSPIEFTNFILVYETNTDKEKTFRHFYDGLSRTFITTDSLSNADGVHLYKMTFRGIDASLYEAKTGDLP